MVEDSAGAIPGGEEAADGVGAVGAGGLLSVVGACEYGEPAAALICGLRCIAILDPSISVTLNALDWPSGKVEATLTCAASKPRRSPSQVIRSRLCSGVPKRAFPVSAFAVEIC